MNCAVSCAYADMTRREDMIIHADFNLKWICFRVAWPLLSQAHQCTTSIHHYCSLACFMVILLMHDDHMSIALHIQSMIDQIESQPIII